MVRLIRHAATQIARRLTTDALADHPLEADEDEILVPDDFNRAEQRTLAAFKVLDDGAVVTASNEEIEAASYRPFPPEVQALLDACQALVDDETLPTQVRVFAKRLKVIMGVKRRS